MLPSILQIPIILHLHTGAVMQDLTVNQHSDPQENDVAIHNENQADINDFENIEPDHHARLRDLTHEIDHLHQKVKANKTEPMDAISHLECKLNRLALKLCLSTLLKPLRRFCNNIQTLYVLHKRKCPL